MAKQRWPGTPVLEEPTPVLGQPDVSARAITGPRAEAQQRWPGEPVSASPFRTPTQPPEATLEAVRTWDIEDLLSGEVGIEALIGPELVEPLNFASRYVPRKELAASFRLGEYLKQTGAIGHGDITAHKAAAMAVQGETTAVGALNKIRTNWDDTRERDEAAAEKSQGFIDTTLRNLDIGLMSGKALGKNFVSSTGRMLAMFPAFIERLADRALLNPYSRKVFELLTSRDLTPQPRPGGFRGERWPEPGGGQRGLQAVEKVIAEHPDWQPKQVAGGFRELLKDPEAIAGRLGAALPVTLGAITAGVAGGPGASIMLIGMVESESEYQEAIASGASEEEANTRSDIVMVINTAIEYAQIGHLKRLFNIGGGKQVIVKLAVKKAKRTLASRALKTLTGEQVRRIAFNSIGEAVEEAAQGTVSELTALGISGEEIKAGFVSRRLEEAMIGGLLAGGAVGTGVVTRKLRGPPAALGVAPEAPPTPEGVVPPVTSISRIMHAEEVIPRVDVSQLGKTLIEDIAAPESEIELLTTPKRRTIALVRKEAARMDVDVSDIKGKGAVAAIEERLTEAEKVRPLPERGRKPLTVEEQHQLKQSEATLAAEESLTIKPELYIGNVTPRMQRVFAKALGVTPEEIGTFRKGPFTTKRAEIELTMGEGREYLFHLETSIQERLDNDQVHSHHDLALINADWGDVKELRKRLGLVTVTRPFVIDKDQVTKIVTIENVKERIRKTVHVAEGDVIAITEMDRLNLAMRKVASATTKGFKLGKAAARKAYAELQYLRKQKQIRERLIGRLMFTPSKQIDFFYREAIKKLQDAVDFKNTTEQQQAAKEGLRQHIARQTAKVEAGELEKVDDIPPDKLEALTKKDVLSLSITDLRTLDEEMQRLRQLGLLKSRAYRLERARGIKAMSDQAVASIEAAPKPRLKRVQAWSLRPLRIFDRLEGGKKFKGPLAQFFYWTTNANVDVELRNTDLRQATMRERAAELGIVHQNLMQLRTIGDLTLTLDQFLSIYAGWKNASSQASHRYGGVMQKVKGVETFVPVTDAMMAEIDEALSDTEKTWGDTIIQEYGEFWDDRGRYATIRAENRDPGRQENYTKMRTIDVEYQTSEQEMVDALARRHFFSQVGPHKAFTIERKDIPAEYRKPIQLGLTQIWIEEVRKQEHYVNNALHLKDMRAVANRKEFRAAVREKFGNATMETVDAFIDRNANPDYYKAFTDVEKVSKILRRHTSIAFVGANLSTMMIQGPSVLLYAAEASMPDMIASAADAVLRPRQSFERAKAIHYQLAHQNIEREISEMRSANVTAYDHAIIKMAKRGQAGLGKWSFWGILAIDRAVRVIGINAVYNKAIRDGLSVAEATEKAVSVTLRTQPAAHPKDLARLYSTNELLNWFTMFTNQLNQIYNITTYDIPAAWRSGQYRQAIRQAMALGTMGLLVWMIRNGRLPEELEEIVEAFTDQALSSVPLVGRLAVSKLQGWDPSAPAPLKAVGGIVSAGEALVEGDFEKAAQRAVEPAAVLFGLPLQGGKDLYELYEWFEEK